MSKGILQVHPPICDCPGCRISSPVVSLQFNLVYFGFNLSFKHVGITCSCMYACVCIYIYIYIYIYHFKGEDQVCTLNAIVCCACNSWSKCYSM